MKKTYSRPIVTNSDILVNSNGVFPAVAALAGYAAGRAITKAVKASPSMKMPSLTRRNRN